MSEAGFDRTVRDNDLNVLLVEALDLVRQSIEHNEELEEAWRRGAISEHDGKGDTRSNRNEALVRRMKTFLVKRDE